MPGVIENLLSGIVFLINGSLLIGIPVILVSLAGKKLFERFSKTHSWTVSVWSSTYIIVLGLLIVAYFFPFWLGFSEFAQGTLPDVLAPTLADQLLRYLFSILRLLALSAVFSVLILPIAFFGEALFDYLKNFIHAPLSRFVAAVLGSFWLAFILVLFVLPAIGIDLITGSIYLLYFA